MGKLTFSKQQSGDITILSIGGTIDTGVAPQLESELKAAIGSGKKFIGDLAGLDHITSAGIGVLIAIKNELKGKGGDIKLVNVSEKIMKVFALLNLTKLVQVLPTVEDARKAY